MENLWEELNDKVPNYFQALILEYDLSIVKLNQLNTALVCPKYALIIGIDRFYADIKYISRNKDGVLVKYMINNFFSEKFDERDRQNLIEGNGAKESIINSLIIISQGMQNKWKNVLEGDNEWIKVFEKSKWYETTKLRDYELQLNDIID